MHALAPQPHTTYLYATDVSSRWFALSSHLAALQIRTRSGEPVSRKQLALYQERDVTPTRATDTTRITLTWMTRWFDWQQALVIVQPATLIRWHRQGFRLLWRWRSRPGRPAIPPALQGLIRRMACDNPTRGEERIANELLLKLGLRVSPRTVRKYLPKRLDHGRGKGVPSQRWRSFVRNHAQTMVACDFC
jgi:putative transposase